MSDSLDACRYLSKDHLRRPVLHVQSPLTWESQCAKDPRLKSALRWVVYAGVAMVIALNVSTGSLSIISFSTFKSECNEQWPTQLEVSRARSRVFMPSVDDLWWKEGQIGSRRAFSGTLVITSELCRTLQPSGKWSTGCDSRASSRLKQVLPEGFDDSMRIRSAHEQRRNSSRILQHSRKLSQVRSG